MEARLNAQQASPAAYAAMISLGNVCSKTIQPRIFTYRTREDACLADQWMCLLY
jgi:hypothetical protein